MTTRPASIDPLDFLDLDGDLSAEDAAAAADRALLGRAASAAAPPRPLRARRVPPEWPRELGELGLLGMQLDGYGLPGASALAHGLACLELEAGDSGLRSFVSVQGSLACSPSTVRLRGAEGALARPMAAGEALGCFALTEPDAGSDPAACGPAQRATAPAGCLDGAKMWITNGSRADVAVVWAQTDEGVRGFLVPTDAPGFTAADMDRKLSLRASVTSELALDGVRLPGDAILPQAGACGRRCRA